MKNLNLERIHDIQLQMLEQFSKFCEENELRYFLDAGTLLGAVRHDGFIPWDDDVDVGMPRPDYERLIDIAQNGIGKNLVLLYPEESIYPMLKIINKKTYLLEFPNSIKNEIGIYIDVFPKDGLPSNKFLSFVLCKSVRTLILLNWFVKVSIYKWKDDEKLFKRVLSFVGRAFVNKNNKNIFQKLLTKIAKMYKFENSKYVSTIIAGGMKNTVLKEYLNNYKLHKFENLYLNIPKGWDEYLTKLYGDYMQIPDKSQRGKHDYIAYELS